MIRRSRFPDPRTAETHQGIIAVGGGLDSETLLDAYTHGIFPWPMEGMPLTWFCPDERALLTYREMHLSRSLRRAWNQRHPRFRFSFNEAFETVIEACAQVHRPSQPADPYTGETLTWITPGMKRAYRRLHKLGRAHSVEVWEGERLVAGVYGVDPGGAFSAESMFHLVPNASKLALVHLMEYLHARGVDWIDIQVETPHMKGMGAKLVPKAEFLDLLKVALERGVELFPGTRPKPRRAP